MCEHLIKAEEYIKSKGIPEYWRGQPWTDNCREWIYFDCRFDPAALKEKLALDPCVQVHDYFDIKAGAELGLYCSICKDGVMGVHPKSPPYGDRPVLE
jgi:hypothetical protein